jgi:hypothetical protein
LKGIGAKTAADDSLGALVNQKLAGCHTSAVGLGGGIVFEGFPLAGFGIESDEPGGASEFGVEAVFQGLALGCNEEDHVVFLLCINILSILSHTIDKMTIVMYNIVERRIKICTIILIVMVFMAPAVAEGAGPGAEGAGWVIAL